MILIPTVYYMAAIRVFYKSKYVGVILKGILALILNLIVLLFVFVVYAVVIAIYATTGTNNDVKVFLFGP